MPDTDEELGDDLPIVACVTVGAFQENCYLFACPHTHEGVMYKLEDDLIVFPGHGRPTSIIEEKYENPFVTLEE